MKPANATVQDDIPPVHVLEAAQNQDRKETEDLLAGFDRPGRSPKPVSKERDFVDYYARKKPGGNESGGRGARDVASASASASGAGGSPSRQRDVSTVIVNRDRKPMPVWLGWAAVALGMLVVGGAVAYLATSDGHSSAVERSAPSAATTITSSTTPVQANAENIPPPDPSPPPTLAVTVVEPTPSAPVATAQATTTATTARSASKRDGRTVPSAATDAPATTAPAMTARSTNATEDRKPPPRDDFIRDL